MKLFIAEKEKVADAIARQIPTAKKQEYYYVYDGGYIAWAKGHLFKTSYPEDYNPDWIFGNMDILPIFPAEWKLLEDRTFGKGNLLKTIKELASKNEVTEIINAADADREGQLLLHEILNYIGNQKPVKRFWTESNDAHTIKKALENLKDDNDPKYKGMYHSAFARSQADWLYGINASRYFSGEARKAGHYITFNIGRVKTPLVSLIVRREQEIESFKKIEHYGLKATFKKGNEEFQATWKPSEDQEGLNEEKLMIDKGLLDKKVISLRSLAEGAVIKYETKEKKEAPRKLYSLTTLQKEAGRLFGYSPDQVLAYTQSLYENEFVTYPRSDSQYLPEEQLQDAPDILASLGNSNHFEIKTWLKNIDPAQKSSAWDDKKTTAHHAIIPTRALCPLLDLKEEYQRIYLLIVRSYIAQFLPDYIYYATSLEIAVGTDCFSATGKVDKDLGWKKIFNSGTINITKNKEDPQEDEECDEKKLPALAIGDICPIIDFSISKIVTKPPKRFADWELPEVMTNIHQYLKNPDLAKVLKKNKGIGTEATKGPIIKELFSKDFLAKEKGRVFPTTKSVMMVGSLPDEITWPDQTALWEENLAEIEAGELDPDSFINNMKNWISELLKNKVEVESQKCPQCEVGFLRQRKGTKGFFWSCSNWKPDRSGCNATYQDKNGKPDLNPEIIPCPTCKKGSLRKIKGAKGTFWGCSNFKDGCKATFDDYRNKPDFTGKKKTTGAKKK